MNVNLQICCNSNCSWAYQICKFVVLFMYSKIVDEKWADLGSWLWGWQIYLDRLRLEKEEGRGLNPADNVNEELDEKNKKFKELHGYSATLNLLSLAGLTYHAWNMVSRVHVWKNDQIFVFILCTEVRFCSVHKRCGVTGSARLTDD